MTRSRATSGAERALGGLALGILALTGNHLGPLSRSSALAAATTGLVLYGAAVLMPRVRPPSPDAPAGAVAGLLRSLPVRMAAVLLVLVAAALLVARAPLPAGPTAGATLLLLLVGIAGERRGSLAAGLASSITAAGLTLTGYDFVTAAAPPAWVVVEAATRRLTGALGSWTGSETSLGPSVAGVPLLLLVVAFLAARARAPGGSRWLLLSALGWIGAITAFVWGLGIPVLVRGFLLLSALINGPVTGIPISGYPASLAVWLPLPFFLALLCAALGLDPGTRNDAAVTPAPAPRGEATRSGPLHSGALRSGALHSGALHSGALRSGDLRSGLIAGGMAVLALAGSLPRIRYAAPEDRPRITLLDRGMVGWEVPSYGRLGLEQAGMFGLLPHYLEAARYTVRRDRDGLSQTSIDQSDVLVVINPSDRPTAQERSRVERFVSDGGGLLVLGDHTDIAGIMTPLNELLDPYGIAFRFDSAFTPTHWRNDAGFLPGPLTRGLDDANSRFGQSTGASLELRVGAEPVATARWGFSDAGNRANAQNAFLGDYIYQEREPLGDLPVVAMRRHGRGRVIVFGDTSAFQNVSIAFSWPFLDRVFQTAAGRNLPATGGLSAPAVLLWSLGALALLVLGAPRRWVGGALTGTWVGLMLGGLCACAAEPSPRPLAAPLAVVDAAHDNRVHLGLWDGESLAGLCVNLSRSGLLPLVDREGSAALPDTARIFLSVAPRRGFSAEESLRLRAFAQRGGEVVLAVGWEFKDGAGSLLSMSALDLAPVPLGPVPILRKIADPELYKLIEQDPHFAEAWPVEGVQPGRDEVLYAAEGYPVIVRRPMGRGGFTLIADPKFLLNRTLEQEGAAWQGNIMFLKGLFERAASPGGAGAIRP